MRIIIRYKYQVVLKIIFLFWLLHYIDNNPSKSPSDEATNNNDPGYASYLMVDNLQYESGKKLIKFKETSDQINNELEEKNMEILKSLLLKYEERIKKIKDPKVVCDKIVKVFQRFLEERKNA